MRRLLTAVALWALLSLPRAAQACSVCFDARDENRMAFIVTTGILTLLPLVMFGAAVWLLRRRFAAREGQELSQRLEVAGDLWEPYVNGGAE